MIQINLFTKQNIDSQTEKKKKKRLSKWIVGVREKNKEFRTDTYTLLYIK